MHEVTATMGQVLAMAGSGRKVVDEFRVLCEGGLPERVNVVSTCLEGVYALIESDWDGEGPERCLECRTEMTGLDRVMGIRHLVCGNTSTKYGMSWIPSFCPVCGGRVTVHDAMVGM